jgi:hypothetical protein
MVLKVAADLREVLLLATVALGCQLEVHRNPLKIQNLSKIASQKHQVPGGLHLDHDLLRLRNPE